LAVEALRALDEVGAQVEDIAVHQPSLDNVFALLIGALTQSKEKETSA
jgi:hypothetical protein